MYLKQVELLVESIAVTPRSELIFTFNSPPNEYISLRLSRLRIIGANSKSTSPNVNVVWTAPSGSVVVQGQGTPEAVIKFSQSFTGGVVEVYAENACGTSDVTELFVGAVPAVIG